jgi:hypothetical protein
MRGVSMPIIRTKRLEIPMEGNSAWTVVLTHETADEAVHVALHFGQKENPTHEGWVPLSDLREMFEDDGA